MLSRTVKNATWTHISICHSHCSLLEDVSRGLFIPRVEKYFFIKIVINARQNGEPHEPEKAGLGCEASAQVLVCFVFVCW